MRFKKDDLVICKPSCEIPEESKGHLIYARVVSVDRENDKLFLDRYLEHGKVALCGKAGSIYERVFREGFSLSDMEKENFYQPMELSEIKEFRDGLKEGLGKRSYQFYRGIHDSALSKAYIAQTEETLAVIEDCLQNEKKVQKKTEVER